MNCHDFKDKVFEYIDDSLDEKTTLAMRDHLKTCRICDELYDQEMNLSDEPLTEIFEEINDMKLKDETINEITTKLLDLDEETKQDPID